MLRILKYIRVLCIYVCVCVHTNPHIICLFCSPKCYSSLLSLTFAAHAWYIVGLRKTINRNPLCQVLNKIKTKEWSRQDTTIKGCVGGYDYYQQANFLPNFKNILRWDKFIYSDPGRAEPRQVSWYSGVICKIFNTLGSGPYQSKQSTATDSTDNHVGVWACPGRAWFCTSCGEQHRKMCAEGRPAPQEKGTHAQFILPAHQSNQSFHLSREEWSKGVERNQECYPNHKWRWTETSQIGKIPLEEQIQM